eukprot:2588604-Amphidinium_carterae.1
MAWLLRHWRDVLFLLLAFDVLADVANLRLNMGKCRILPMGVFDVAHWRVALQDAYTVGHRVHLLQIVDHVKYLGIALSRHGRVPFDYFTALRLESVASMLASLWAGGVRNAELLGVVLEGMVRYPLSMSSPSDMLENAWLKAQRILSITSLGVSEAHHVLPELFAWPRRILPLKLIALQAQATPCLKAFTLIEEAWADLQVAPSIGSAVHPAEYWRTNGCASSWHSLLQLLRGRRLIDGAGNWLIDQKMLGKVLREQLLPSLSQTRMTLECKLSRSWSADLPSRFLNML